VVSDFGFNSRRSGATLDHHVGIGRRQRRARELVSAAPDGAEQRPLGIVGNLRLLEVGRQGRQALRPVCASLLLTNSDGLQR
jgi:hypothetical protein